MTPRILRRALLALIAWAVGWLVYMTAMAMTVYDGIPSLILQPIMALLVSALAVGISLTVGLVFRIPTLGRLWSQNRCVPGLLGFLSVLLMLFGNSLGLTQQYTDREIGRQFTGLHSGIAFSSDLVLVFSITNFPAPYRHES